MIGGFKCSVLAQTPKIALLQTPSQIGYDKSGDKKDNKRRDQWAVWTAKPGVDTGNW